MKKMSEGITKEELQKIYNDNDMDTVAKILNCSKSCVYATLKVYHIPLKGRGGNRNRKIKIIG